MKQLVMLSGLLAAAASAHGADAPVWNCEYTKPLYRPGTTVRLQSKFTATGATEQQAVAQALDDVRSNAEPKYGRCAALKIGCADVPKLTAADFGLSCVPKIAKK